MSPSIAPTSSVSKTLQEEVQSVRLPSGLRVMFCPKPGFKKRYASYSTFYGSVDNEFIAPDGGKVKVPDGIAHFLEHTLFEMEEANVSDLFARNGADNNAFTSFTTTTYLFASTAERFYDNLELLIRFVENPLFRKDRVDKERGIIEQEIKGYEDSPQWVSYMGLLENLFVKHPQRIDIAGTTQSISEIDAGLLQKCYETFYNPSNMILFFVGDLDPDELFDFVLAHSRSGPAGSADAAKIERIYPEEPAKVHRQEFRKRMSVALPKLLLGFKELGVPASGRAFVERELVSSLALEVLFGRSSDLYRDLYDQQLIMDDFGASYNSGAGVGYSLIGGETPDPDRLRDALFGRASKLRKDGVEREDFEREKRRFLGNFISAFNSLDYIANNFTHYRFYDFDLFEAVDLIAGIDESSVDERLAEILEPDQHASYVVEPEKASG